MNASDQCTARFDEIIATQEPVRPSSHSALVAWLFFNVSSSQALLPILLLCLWYTNPRAEHTLINLVVTWIISGLVACILLYSGHATGCEPPPVLCLTQASLFTAVPTLTTSALFAAVLQIFFNVREKLTRGVEIPNHSVRRVCLLLMPYIVYAIFATTVAAVGATGFESMVSRTRRFFFCSVKSNALINMVFGYCATVIVLSLFFSGWIGLLLRQNYTYLERSIHSRPDFGYIYRILAFLPYNIIVLTFGLVPRSALNLQNFTWALTPYVVFAIFASQRTVLPVLAAPLQCVRRPNFEIVNSRKGKEVAGDGYR